MLRPSSFPALALSPLWEPGDSEFLEPGTRRHHALRKLYYGEPDALKEIPEDEHEGMEWAVEHIRLHAPSDLPIQFEAKSRFLTSNFDEIEGTPDCECGPMFFDLKWRERDYTSQMACYALMRIQSGGYRHVTCDILFAESRRYQRIHFTEESALAIVEPIIERVKTSTECRTSDYCAWCSKRLTCPTFQAPALASVEAREDWKLSTWHPSQLEDPAEMAKAVRAVKFLRNLADSIAYHAVEMWMKKGVQIPGCKIQTRAGKRICIDMNGAFNALGLEPSDFLTCASLRFSTSKKDASRAGLENVYAKAKGISVSAAKKELKRILEPFIKQTEASVSVVPEKSLTEETEEE